MIVIIIVITIECLARLVGCTAACRTDYQRPEILVKRDALLCSAAAVGIVTTNVCQSLSQSANQNRLLLPASTGCCTKCSVAIIIILITEEKAFVVACRQPAAFTPPFPGATAAAVLMVDKCCLYHKAGTKHNF